MRNSFYIPLFILATIILLNTCKKSDMEKNKTLQIVKEKVTGYIQKGPFINGTTINISELNAKLGQTGKVFNTTITNDKGSFEVDNIELSSQYVEFKALGFYFNEISGDKSTSQLTLNALSDLTDISTVNVNILTHLEESRVKYLVNKGISFAKAKDSTQMEVLALFGFAKNGMTKSEMLDISVNNNDNAILLAMSVILQGNRSVADLTEIMANIITDIKEDGILNNERIMSSLYNTTQDLDLLEVRKNLEKRYEDLGVVVTIPNFEQYVSAFLVSQKPFNIENLITNVSCYGANNGKIDITIREGTPPFTYIWSNGAITEDVTGLAPGSYSVTITDANKYILVKKNIPISEPPTILISGSIIKATCESNNGAIDITVSGGTPPYLYSWSNGATTEDLSNIKAGNYTITVTDVNQCPKSKEFVVGKNITDIIVSGIVSNATSCESKNGSIDITVSGGTPPYLYSWSNGATTEDLSNIKGGNYTITVTDANQCPKSQKISVVSPVCDVEGNEYKTVAIGNQVWMAENLKPTHYNDGTAIPLVIDITAWSNLTTPGYCWYNNDAPTNKNTYGALYNWYTVNTGKLCPIGWHVPTDTEWSTLSNFLGGVSVAGGKLKEIGLTHWWSPNAGATDEIGFNALPAGCRESLGRFTNKGNIGGWLSSTAYSNGTENGSCYVDYTTSYFKLFHNVPNRSAFSVRCIMDE